MILLADLLKILVWNCRCIIWNSVLAVSLTFSHWCFLITHRWLFVSAFYSHHPWPPAHHPLTFSIVGVPGQSFQALMRCSCGGPVWSVLRHKQYQLLPQDTPLSQRLPHPLHCCWGYSGETQSAVVLAFFIRSKSCNIKTNITTLHYITCSSFKLF